MTRKDKLEKKLEIAMVTYSDKNYEEAITQFDEIIDYIIETENVNALLYRGISYFYTQSYNPAIWDFDEVLTMAPKNTKAYFYRGLIYYKNKKYCKAISDFDRAIELDPDFKDAITERDNCFQELNNSNTSEKLKNISIESNTEKTKDIRDALKDLIKYFSTDDLSTLCEYGICLFDSEKYDEAFNVFKKIIDIVNEREKEQFFLCMKPQVFISIKSAYYYMSLYFYKRNQYKNVIDNVEKFLNLNKKYRLILLEKEKVAEQVLHYMAAVLLQMRGKSFFILKKYNRAIDDFTKSIEILPDTQNTQNYYNRGICYYYINAYKKAYDDILNAQLAGLKEVDVRLMNDIKIQLGLS